MSYSTLHVMIKRVSALIGLIALFSAVMAVEPRPSQAAGCADWLQKPVRATGTYFPAEEAYARPFVFAMLFDCNGSQVTVTVQRPTGRLPVCGAQQQVEVAGTLSLSTKLIGSYYQINDPTSVTCLQVARAEPSAAQRAPSAPPVPPVSPGRYSLAAISRERPEFLGTLQDAPAPVAPGSMFP